ncbi:GAF domain-containing protein [Floccifex sp.]|uniref:GAF domain-containing protein n=1 Tax=Floccifex sp. TaxID=2815810 RepID=UPI002A74BFE2|nr:GAF domain-containing protein [Floccifex sp.]MDD7280890.1 GAF domain-containing protein [Erysipelotrichaceae bacterium]MDY2958561.1 GAF domain-containing protein [Floccifex sp.]
MNLLTQQLKYLIEDDQYEITSLSNMASFIYNELEDVSWAGFYLYKDEQLILGPFQGKVACTIIKMGSGVCGTSALKQETLVVENVHEFPGHIACDSASNSEIVVPIVVNDKLYGVLDLDSTSFDRFGKDKELIESFVDVLVKKLG